MTASLDRRRFLILAGAIGAMPRVAAASRVEPAVCALHNGQPYLDIGGAAPYLPPAGLCGGRSLAALDETALRHAHFYL